MSIILEITNLQKSYRSPDGQQTSVVDVPHFTLDAAQQVALQGGSGSGKTTFLNMIAGILRPDEGSIKVAGEEIASQSEAGRDAIRAKNIGYVFQTFNLLQGYTALENIEMGMRFGGSVDRQRAKELLDRMGLADRIDYKPRQLSVGQQQRVAVARALANKPRIVLADEPTGNLDRARASEALQLIREICRENGAALLLVSHDDEILQQFEDMRDFSVINRAWGAHSHTPGSERSTTAEAVN